MGSLCCVAARPHGSSKETSEQCTSPYEPYWRTNTSFSPPSPRWDYRFQSEGNQRIHYGSSDSIQLFGSTSSNRKESRSWMRGGYSRNYQSNIEGGVMYCSSPSEASLVHLWTPPPTQRVNMDDFESSAKRGVMSGPLCFTPLTEGTSVVPYSVRSTSSHSDCTEFEHSRNLHLSARNLPNRLSFMSKPIHPLSFPVQPPTLEPSTSLGAGLMEFNNPTLQRDTHRLSSGSSSINLADISDQFEPNYQSRPSNPFVARKCGVCDRLLSQKSPWSSRQIVKSGDMPVTGILFCSHVFHAECLEQTTPKSYKSDPPCPVCTKMKGEKSPEQWVFPRTRNNFPRLRAFSEEEPSGSWGCVQVGHCVEEALHTPQKSSMLLLGRNKMKRSFSLKGNKGKDCPDTPKKTGCSKK